MAAGSAVALHTGIPCVTNWLVALVLCEFGQEGEVSRGLLRRQTPATRRPAAAMAAQPVAVVELVLQVLPAAPSIQQQLRPSRSEAAARERAAAEVAAAV